MEQSTQPSRPVIGVVSGAAQTAYAAPTYQRAAVVTGDPEVTGAVPPPTQMTSAYPTNPANLASQHQLAYQQVQQLHHQQHQQLQAFWANQMLEIEQTTDFKNHSLPLARIKKIMKADGDVRMISAEVPVVFAKACEIFILELTLRSWIHTEENKRRTLQKNDIASAVTRTDIFDFLVDIVPRDELKDDGIGIARAAFPAVGAPADSIPYYYVPAPSQVPGPAMMMGKPVDQAAAATMYPFQQPHSVAYMWQQPPVQQQSAQQQQQVPDGEQGKRAAMESPFKADVLNGKVALITGGGSGIGLEISTQFGRHGAAVAIMGRRRQVVDAAVAALRSEGIRAIGVEGDVRNQEDAARVVEETFKHFGKLDILVNGAAGNFLASPEDLSPNGFRTVMDIDSVGTFTMSHEALKYLKKGGPGKGPSAGGIILNISATLHYTASWYQIHVSAAKAAVDSITRSLALEWGTDYSIRVNGIAPGPIGDTPGMRKLAPEEMQNNYSELGPLYKLGERWDIAMAALYLASDAGKYVNGTTVVVDGGLWLSRPRYIAKEEVRKLSRVVEKKSRNSAVNIPTSKL
ncbi:unnamed protein product [Musa acuminata var. zebrina]